MKNSVLKAQGRDYCASWDNSDYGFDGNGAYGKGLAAKISVS